MSKLGSFFAHALRGITSKPGSRRLARALLFALSTFALVRGGWWITHHLFLVQLPLADVSDLGQSSGEPEDFRYDGVTFFNGHRITHKQRVRHKFRVPTALAADDDASLEIYVRIDGLPDAPPVPNAPPDPAAHEQGLETIYGRLLVTLGSTGETARIDLPAVTLQRVRVPFDVARGEADTLDIQFRQTGWGSEHALRVAREVFGTTPDGIDPDERRDAGASAAASLIRAHAQVEPAAEQERLESLFPADPSLASVCVAAEIDAPNIWKRSLPWVFIGVSSLVGGLMLSRQVDKRLVATLSVVVVASAFFQCGGFISNEYFPGNHGRVAGMASHTAKLLETGLFGETCYRSGGMILVPLVARAMEGAHGLDRGIADVYPGTRYAMWWLSLLATLALVAALHAHVSRAAALVFGMLWATHHTAYVLSLFHPDSDGMLLPLVMLMLACFIRLVHADRGWVWAAGIAAVFAVMMSFKPTPFFLAVLLPVAWWWDLARTRRRWRDWRPAALVIVMLVAGAIGGWAGKAPQHPDRNVGIAGEEFQDSIVWHMLWAANGQFDMQSAFNFTKIGPLRSERIAARTGLPATTYVRQSETATREVYKPDVIEALDERPGFFLSNMSFRFMNHAIQFYRLAHGDYVEMSFDDIRAPGEVQSGLVREVPEYVSGTHVSLPTRGSHADGERLRPPAWPVRLARYGRYWKISTTATVGWLTCEVVTFPVEIALIAAAIVGCVLVRRPGLVVILLGLIALKYGAGIAIHGIDRYFVLSHAALLVGLATTVVCVWHGIERSARGALGNAREPAPSQSHR